MRWPLESDEVSGVWVRGTARVSMLFADAARQGWLMSELARCYSGSFLLLCETTRVKKSCEPLVRTTRANKRNSCQQLVPTTRSNHSILPLDPSTRTNCDRSKKANRRTGGGPGAGGGL